MDAVFEAVVHFAFSSLFQATKGINFVKQITIKQCLYSEYKQNIGLQYNDTQQRLF